MNTEKRGTSRILALLLAVNLLVSIGIIGYLVWERQKTPTLAGQQVQTADKYTLYIGTNDKDTYTQLIPTEQARQIVNEICEEYLGGYTVVESHGGWVDETGVQTTENSMVYTIVGVSEKQLVQVLDAVLEALNQNSILVEYGNVSSLYYTGER